MELLKAAIDEEPDKFARFMQIYYLYNPLFPSCGDGDGAGFESRVLAAWDAAVRSSGQRVAANSDLKRDLLSAASRRVFYLVSQMAPQDLCFAGLSLFVRPVGANRSSIPTKKSENAWFSDRLEAYAFLNDIMAIFSTTSTLTPRSSPHNGTYPYQPYYADDLPSPVLRFAAPLAKCAFNFREYLGRDSSKKSPMFSWHFVPLKSAYSGHPGKGARAPKGKRKYKTSASSRASGSQKDANTKVAGDAAVKEPPPAFSQEYFQEIALPATEDANHPHRTNLAKKAARLQELRKTMNDVSRTGGCIAPHANNLAQCASFGPGYCLDMNTRAFAMELISPMLIFLKPQFSGNNHLYSPSVYKVCRKHVSAYNIKLGYCHSVRNVWVSSSMCERTDRCCCC